MLRQRDTLAAPLRDLEACILAVRTGTFLPDVSRSGYFPSGAVAQNVAPSDEPSETPPVPRQTVRSLVKVTSWNILQPVRPLLQTRMLRVLTRLAHHLVHRVLLLPTLRSNRSRDIILPLWTALSGVRAVRFGSIDRVGLDCSLAPRSRRCVRFLCVWQGQIERLLSGIRPPDCRFIEVCAVRTW